MADELFYGALACLLIGVILAAFCDVNGPVCQGECGQGDKPCNCMEPPDAAINRLIQSKKDWIDAERTEYLGSLSDEGVRNENHRIAR
jgi:hypothetical protein